MVSGLTLLRADAAPDARQNWFYLILVEALRGTRLRARVAFPKEMPRRFAVLSSIPDSRYSALNHHLRGELRNLEAISTRSANESARILRITLKRCTFIVPSGMPRSSATCLFSCPDTIRSMTSRSRGLR
jgi:hypothetical protein